MRNAQLYQFGKASHLKVCDMEDPEPNRHMGIVKVKAASLSHWNARFRQGRIGYEHLAFGPVIGVAGEVVHYPGAQYIERLLLIPSFKPGDKVFCIAFPFGVTGDADADVGEGYYWVKPTSLHGLRTGWSDYALVHPYMLMHMPGHLSYEQAAIFPASYFEAISIVSTFKYMLSDYKHNMVLNAYSATAYMVAIALIKHGESEVILTTDRHNYESLLRAGFERVVINGSPEMKSLLRKNCAVVDLASGKMLEEVVGYMPKGSNIYSSMEYEAHDKTIQQLCKKRRIYINENREYEIYSEKLKKISLSEKKDINEIARDAQYMQGGELIKSLKDAALAHPVSWQLFMQPIDRDYFWPMQPRSFSLDQIQDAHLLMDACPWAGPVAICPEMPKKIKKQWDIGPN